MKPLHFIGCAALMVILGFPAKGLAQVTSMLNHVDALKNKYPWGCIYLTYISLIDIDSILNDESKVQKISQEFGAQSIRPIQAFITKNKGPKISESIAFIQIDLNRLVAGYKRANDNSGVITPIAWSKEEVVTTAELCDRILNAIDLAYETWNRLSTGTTPISVAWLDIGVIREHPYVSDEKVFGVLQQFRRLITAKDGELKKLKGENKVLFEGIEEFRTRFDNSLASIYKLLFDNNPSSWVVLEDRDKVNLAFKHAVVDKMKVVDETKTVRGAKP